MTNNNENKTKAGPLEQFEGLGNMNARNTFRI